MKKLLTSLLSPFNFKLWACFFILTFNHLALTIAQNLVPNPSFEQYSSCPDNNSQFDSVLNWNSYQHFSFTLSPDYFNSCANNSTGVSIPDNFAGFQNASSENAYCGIITYFSNFQIYPYFYHEIIFATLEEPMKIGFKYYISLKVSLADGLGCCASDKLGVLFTTYNDTSISVFNNFAHIFSNSMISDTTNWTTISGSFIADSTYKYIFIGNFFNDTLTNISQPGNCFAYYYIDDICVSEDSLTCNSSLKITNSINRNKIQIYPNPANTKLYIKNELSDKGINKMIIYNYQGIIVDIYYDFEEKFINVANYKKGLYFISIYSDNQIFTQKCIIN